MNRKELKKYVAALPSVADQDVYDLPVVNHAKEVDLKKLIAQESAKSATFRDAYAKARAKTERKRKEAPKNEQRPKRKKR